MDLYVFMIILDVNVKVMTGRLLNYRYMITPMCQIILLE